MQPCNFVLLTVEFFKRKGVCTMTVKELFQFVTDLNITRDTVDDALQQAMLNASQRTVQEVTAQQKIDEEVTHLLTP